MSTSFDRVDATAWPDIARAPKSPIRAAVTRILLERIAATTPVAVRLPDGSIAQRHVDAAWPVLSITSDRFFDRLGADLKIGLGEAYMAGDWVAEDDLADVLTPFAERLLDIVPAWMRAFRRLFEPRHPEDEENHRRGAKRNIERHYDLSNELFSTFLDPTMTYSSAFFDGAEPTWANLESAQRRKVDRVLDLAGVHEGTRLLEIGTGWGQLALQAAERGAIVHSVTLSTEQLQLAQQRIQDAGFADRVTIELRDYRDVQGSFDAIASVEMIEAVGARYWPEYFATVGKLLAPRGRFALQAITMPHDRMLASAHAYTWISKYIFPGGLIPSPDAIRSEGSRSGGMRVAEEYGFGRDYGHTLHLWRQRFIANAERVTALGFDPTFRRMWEFYLAYSEAGFRSGHLDVRHFVMEKAQ